MGTSNFDNVKVESISDTDGGTYVEGVQQANIVAPVAPAALTVGGDIPAFTDPPTAGEMAALRTFVNALKADVTALRSTVDANGTKLGSVVTTLDAFGQTA